MRSWWILAKIVAFESDGKHKLIDKWEEDVYQVLLKLNIEIPVYIVQEDKTGRKRTLHWNLLLQQEDKTGRKRMLHWNLLLPLGVRLAEPVSSGQSSNFLPEETTFSVPEELNPGQLSAQFWRPRKREWWKLQFQRRKMGGPRDCQTRKQQWRIQVGMPTVLLWTRQELFMNRIWMK